MDALNWTTNANGLLVPVVNGPSASDMLLTSGDYVNIASQATVTATNLVSGSSEALTDGVILHREICFLQDAAFNGTATIKLQFAQAQSVYAVALYSGDANAESVRLYLANGESICYTQAASGGLKTVPAEVVAIEIVMPAADTQYAISEIAVMASR